MMTRIVLPRADGVVANSRATLDRRDPSSGPDAAAVVIPSASGLQSAPHPTARELRRRCGSACWRASTRGRGRLLLLEAFAAAFGDGDARLEFAGARPVRARGVPQRASRPGCRELGLESRASRTSGTSTTSPAPRELGHRRAGIRLRPEPLGQNVLQYLAAGVPCIVADEGGPAEWVDDERNGLRVAPRDVAALSAALRRLATDPALRRGSHRLRGPPRGC